MFERKFCNVCDKQNMIKFLNKQKRVYEKMFDSITVRDDAKGARPEGKCLIAEA